MKTPDKLPEELIRILDDIMEKGVGIKHCFEIETGLAQHYKDKYFTMKRTVEVFLN